MTPHAAAAQRPHLWPRCCRHPTTSRSTTLSLSSPFPSHAFPCVQSWARTPLWKRAEYLHRVAAIMRANAQPIADVLVKEVAKPASDAYTGDKRLPSVL